MSDETIDRAPEGAPAAAPAPAPPAGLTRRRALQVLGLAAGGVAAGAGCGPEAPARAADAAHAGHAAGAAPAARGGTFFTPHERETVTVLVDYVIPRDERSGSATDAGVPAFMDAFLADEDTEDSFRARIRGGLAWLDAECGRRFGDGAPAAVAGAAGAAVRPAANVQGSQDPAGRRAAAQGAAQGAGPRGAPAGSDPARGATPAAAPAAQTTPTLTFVRATDAQRRQVLDDIAYPARARPAMSHGVAFFNAFRDFTASGFFSSRVGHEDLRYMGNVAVASWDGCPPEALNHLGVSEQVMATRVPPAGARRA